MKQIQTFTSYNELQQVTTAHPKKKHLTLEHSIKTKYNTIPMYIHVLI